jgi:hypothetical protein
VDTIHTKDVNEVVKGLQNGRLARVITGNGDSLKVKEVLTGEKTQLRTQLRGRESIIDVDTQMFFNVYDPL